MLTIYRFSRCVANYGAKNQLLWCRVTLQYYIVNGIDKEEEPLHIGSGQIKQVAETILKSYKYLEHLEKKSFKYYKSKWPVPSFAEVIDFEQASSTVRPLNLTDGSCDDIVSTSLPLGVRPVHTWRCFTLQQPEGLIVIRNPFTTQGQRYWSARCLRDYPRSSVVNLNAHLFSAPVLDDWWRELQQCKDKNEERRMKISMRWTTLGYHHNWDTKVYSEKMHTKFPNDLAKMCNFFANVVGFDDFAAQAAIVNYYPIGTTLAGHTDHSEVNLSAPLFSFSFGQTAIFLIGGKTKDEKPTALFLQSGDVLVMTQQSRLCYHAVPRVMKARDEAWNDTAITKHVETQAKKKLRTDYKSQPCEWEMDTLLYQQIADEIFWLPFKSYLNDSRININVRQVLAAGATQLPQ